MTPQNPIGIFDSGIGGLTVANAVSKLLPEEELIYFGDTAHLPYGDKSAEAIQHYSIRIADFLLDKNCKLLLIACNTASAAAFDVVKAHVAQKTNDTVPVVNVIDPVVERVAADTTIHKIGIIGTKGTIKSGTYEHKLKALRPDLETVGLATALLASMIEAGFYNNSVSQAVINSYLAYPDFSDIQGMILACTHYPLIEKEVAAYFNHRIKIFDSTNIVAGQVKDTLESKKLLNNKRRNPHHFYVSDFTDSFEQTTKIFFDEKIHLEQSGIWE
ncbi:MAG: glutamate racemase [Chitinophagales bacterium]|nr:glutamate racemase [Chitinophagales bacterium]